MPLTRFSADTFGVVTIALVTLLVLLGLFCIYRSLYFQIRILRREFLQLVYFNGPWVTRIVLVLVAIWWGIWEILRLTLLKEKLRLFSSVTWQKNICKIYILSNFGFAEPGIFLTIILLLHASLQKRESGTLSQRWNRKAILYVLLFCLPILTMQVVLVFIGPKVYENEKGRTRMSRYINTSSMVEGIHVCTYPLFSTSFLGLFDILLILYATYVGRRLLVLVINKGLRRRVYWLTLSILLFLPLRVSLLVLSAFMHPGSMAFQTIIFLAFCMLLVCAVVGICMLVYCPVADSLALRDLGQMEILELPYDDYYHGGAGASLIANRSHLNTGSYVGTGRNSDASTKHGSISFRTMIRDEPATSEGSDEADVYPAALHITSPSDFAKFKNLGCNTTGGSLTLTSFGKSCFVGAKVEDSVSVGRRFKLRVNAGRVSGHGQMANGGSMEATVGGRDYPVRGEKVRFAVSALSFKKETVLEGSLETDFRVSRGGKVSVNASLNSRKLGQISCKFSTSEHAEIGFIAIVSLIRALFRGGRRSYATIDE